MTADAKPRIFSNTTFLALGLITNALIGLYITRALARYLGVGAYGLYALAFVYLNFTAVIANFGFDAILVREIARERGDPSAIATAGIVLKLIFAGAAFLAGAAYLAGRGYPAAYTRAVMFLLLAHFVAAFDTFGIVHRARLRGGTVAASTVLSQGLTLGVVLWGRARGWPLEWLIAAYFFVRIPSVAFLFVRLRAIEAFRWRWEPARARYILRESALIGVTGLLWVLYFRVDTLMLEWIKGPEAVGQYAAAYKFVDLALLGSGLVMSSLGPLLAERWPGNPDGFRWLYRQTVNYMAMLGALLAGALVVLGPDIIRIIFSPRFTDAIAVLRILSVTVFLMFMNNAFGHAMVTVGIQGPGFLVTRLVGTVLNVALNLLWIPRWGVYGAAWATLVSEVVNFILSPGFVRYKAGIWPRPWIPAFGVATVWLAWRAYLAAGGGRLAATWPGRLAGVGVLVAAICVFALIHRRQFLELLAHFRGRARQQAPEQPAP